jgi:hypothetical protein
MSKILILGHARHGKGTVATMMNEIFGLTSKSSSVAASEIFLFDALKDKYGYSSPEECFEDRVNHRTEWYNLICEYNEDDKARLAKEIMKANDIYDGMRDNGEIEECKRQGVFDLIIGIYDPRKPLEPASSFNIDMNKHSDIIINNSGTLDDFEK